MEKEAFSMFAPRKSLLPSLYCSYILEIGSKINSPFEEQFFITIDGRTPGTRNLLESKLGYGESFFFSGNPRFTNEQKANKLAEWTVQKNKEISVSKQCGYNLTWSFSDRSAYELANDTWEIFPPKPGMQYKPYIRPS